MDLINVSLKSYNQWILVCHRSKPDGSDTWKLDTIKKITPILDFIDKYTHWLIFKFTSIAKKARLIPKRLRKKIIKKGMTA